MQKFLTFLVIVLLSCAEDDGPSMKIFTVDGSLIHDNETRTYRVVLPESYYDSNNTLPLLLGLHGGFGSGTQFEIQSELSEKANTENFIVVYPDGLPNPALGVRTWNAGKCCGSNASLLETDDVGFISKLIDQLMREYRVDGKRIYATGHSNGAMMCYRLANELSEKIAAIAPTAGNFQITTPYTPVRNVPVVNISSKLDMNVKYEGGMTEGPGGQYNPPTDSCLDVVAAIAGCTDIKTTVQTFPLYTIYSWKNCSSADFEVLLYLTEDGGHAWPGGNKGSQISDSPSQAFSNNDIIWDFLKKYSLP